MSEKSQLSMRKFIDKSLIINIGLTLLTLLIICGIAVLFLEFGSTRYADKAKPKQYLGRTNVSGMTPDELQASLPQTFGSYLDQTVIFTSKGQSPITLENRELGALVNESESLKQVQFYTGKPTYAQFFADLLRTKRHSLVVDYDVETASTTIDSKLTQLHFTHDARFTFNVSGDVSIESEVAGVTLNKVQLESDLKSQAQKITLQTTDTAPTILEADLVNLAGNFKSLIAATITLNFEDLKFEFNFKNYPNLIQLYKLADRKVGIAINKAEFNAFIQSTLEPTIEREPDNIDVTLLNARGVFSGIGESGASIDNTKFVVAFEEAANDIFINQYNNYQLNIPVIETPPHLNVSEELKARGIRELVATGYTTYHGSPPNRIHNIKVGIEKYNGLIIPKGAKFSFNENLGEVDAVNGFLPELVIKAEGTIPEFGGGLCQVSTTLYRGVLNAGLKVLERRNHSYAVSYYSQVLGHGLDATIYPGSADFVFVNDSPGDLLLQSFVNGTTATFRLFGTNDGRTVQLEGPTILSETGSGDPTYILDANLPPGTKQLKDSAHGGLRTYWKQTIKHPTGKTDVVDIYSNYAAHPAKWLVSPDMVPNTAKNILNQSPSGLGTPLDEFGMPRI